MRDKVDLAPELYRDLKVAAGQGFPKLQIEQNDKHLRADHFTTLGMVDRRARPVVTALRS